MRGNSHDTFRAFKIQISKQETEAAYTRVRSLFSVCSAHGMASGAPQRHKAALHSCLLSQPKKLGYL